MKSLKWVMVATLTAIVVACSADLDGWYRGRSIEFTVSGSADEALVKGPGNQPEGDKEANARRVPVVDHKFVVTPNATGYLYVNPKGLGDLIAEVKEEDGTSLGFVKPVKSDCSEFENGGECYVVTLCELGDDGCESTGTNLAAISAPDDPTAPATDVTTWKHVYKVYNKSGHTINGHLTLGGATIDPKGFELTSDQQVTGVVSWSGDPKSLAFGVVVDTLSDCVSLESDKILFQYGDTPGYIQLTKCSLVDESEYSLVVNDDGSFSQSGSDVDFISAPTPEGEVDNDGDGYCEGSDACADDATYGDCNDSNASIHPNADEVANQIDDDCNGLIDDGLLTGGPDADGDNYCSNLYSTCADPSDQVGDCRDNDATIHPGATEVTNSTDDDCDGLIDEGLGSGPITGPTESWFETPTPSAYSCLAIWGVDVQLEQIPGTSVWAGCPDVSQVFVIMLLSDIDLNPKLVGAEWCYEPGPRSNCANLVQAFRYKGKVYRKPAVISEFVETQTNGGGHGSYSLADDGAGNLLLKDRLGNIVAWQSVTTT